MKTKNSNIQKFIDFLEHHLCKNRIWAHGEFAKVGPRSFFFSDKTDTIFVKVTDENLIIITDGDEVIDGMEMTRLYLPADEKNGYDWGIICNAYLQDILNKF